MTYKRHYSETHRWSHIHNAWILNESWNDKEEIAMLKDSLAKSQQKAKDIAEAFKPFSYITLLHKYGRAELGIDGNSAFALLGGDLQEGEAEFVEITQSEDETVSMAERRAAGDALVKLRARLSMPKLSYYLGRGLAI